MSAHVYIGGFDATASKPSLDAESFCSQVAERFGVRIHEVALLRVEGAFLRFVFPAALRWGGDIPLGSSALAARTARDRRPELSNGFAMVPHWRLFERIQTGGAGAQPPQPIQKIMSAPAIDSANTLTGVIQVSRKADTRDAAGPDFHFAELEQLHRMACEFAGILPLLPMIETRPTEFRVGVVVRQQ